MTPSNNDALGVQAKGIDKQGKTDNEHFEATPADQQGRAENKRFSTSRARLAIAGYGLSRTDASDGAVNYHASRWGMVRALDNLAAVESFVDQVGARA